MARITYSLFLIALSSTFYVHALAAPVFSGTLTKCTEHQILGNLVASRLFGTWQMQNELTSTLTDHIPAGNNEIIWEFSEDESVAPLFGGLGDKAGCYFTQGQVNFRAKMEEGTLKEGSSPFILVSQNGNSVLIVDESGQYSNTGSIEFHPLNVTIGRAADPSNDILFIGGDNNNQGLAAYKRINN
jgi:hypothetical protein